MAYYAEPDVTISSWAQCLEDDAKEFVRRNYTKTPAGEDVCSWAFKLHSFGNLCVQLITNLKRDHLSLGVLKS